MFHLGDFLHVEHAAQPHSVTKSGIQKLELVRSSHDTYSLGHLELSWKQWRMTWLYEYIYGHITFGKKVQFGCFL